MVYIHFVFISIQFSNAVIQVLWTWFLVAYKFLFMFFLSKCELFLWHADFVSSSISGLNLIFKEITPLPQKSSSISHSQTKQAFNHTSPTSSQCPISLTSLCHKHRHWHSVTTAKHSVTTAKRPSLATSSQCWTGLGCSRGRWLPSAVGCRHQVSACCSPKHDGLEPQN